MTIKTLDVEAHDGEHAVHFYAHDADLIDAVCPYLAAGLRTGEAVVVIATESHRRAFETRLRSEGMDLTQARADGLFHTYDAALAMARLMVDGDVDHDAFQELVGGLVRRAGGGGRVVRAYGEIVTLLWDAGKVAAAIELEGMWNGLATRLPFSLLCSYPSASVTGAEHVEALHHVCQLHSSVNAPAPGGLDGFRDWLTDSSVLAQFPAESDAPGRARRLVTTALRLWGHGDPLVNDAALVLSELATNAVRHARSPFVVEALVEDASLRLTVRDFQPLAAMLSGNSMVPDALHGLGLIDELCSAWGVENRHDGKSVWAELSI